MANWLFILTLAFLLTPLFIWGFRALPRERWQIICTIPVRKMADGSWQGLNLTYYGLFNATSLCAAVALVLILTAAAGVDVRVFAAVTCVLLMFCLPASRLMAHKVEKKHNTFSVGAASFLGIVLGPWLVWLTEAAVQRLAHMGFNNMAVMSALVVGYALGEGIGRLACISFGCCYGRPMDQMPRLVRRYFSWATFTGFAGSEALVSAVGAYSLSVPISGASKTDSKTSKIGIFVSSSSLIFAVTAEGITTPASGGFAR